MVYMSNISFIFNCIAKKGEDLTLNLMSTTKMNQKFKTMTTKKYYQTLINIPEGVIVKKIIIYFYFRAL